MTTVLALSLLVVHVDIKKIKKRDRHVPLLLRIKMEFEETIKKKME